jgi:hypothetical protein
MWLMLFLFIYGVLSIMLNVFNPFAKFVAWHGNRPSAEVQKEVQDILKHNSGVAMFYLVYGFIYFVLGILATFIMNPSIVFMAIVYKIGDIRAAWVMVCLVTLIILRFIWVFATTKPNTGVVELSELEAADVNLKQARQKARENPSIQTIDALESAQQEYTKILVARQSQPDVPKELKPNTFIRAITWIPTLYVWYLFGALIAQY